MIDFFHQEITNNEELKTYLRRQKMMSRSHMLEVIFNAQIECRGYRRDSLAKKVRDHSGDQVIVDCRDWLSGDRRNEYLLHEYPLMSHAALKLCETLFKTDRVRIDFNNDKLKTLACLDDPYLLERAQLTTEKTPAWENDYLLETSLVIDLETLFLVAKCLHHDESISRSYDVLFPKIVTLNGKGLDEKTLFVPPEMTYQELLEVHGQIDEEPYGLILESFYGRLQRWEDIRGKKVVEGSRTNFGTVHFVKDQSHYTDLWLGLFTDYECYRCLSCTYLRKGVEHSSEKDILKSELLQEMSKKYVKSSFQCSLPEHFFSLYRSEHE